MAMMSANMMDYYRTLEVSPGASQDEIKARYKQLVRVYHPDRFVDATDKAFVEQKLKEINEAYNALTNPDRERFMRFRNEALPQPVILPPDGLNFGKMRPGRRHTLAFQVGNAGGAAQKFSLNYDEQSSWFRVAKGERIYPDKPFPVEFVVGVNTHQLEPGRTYSTWIDINMDDVISRVPLSVQVVDKRWTSLLSPRLLVAGLMVALILIVILLPNVRFIFSQSVQGQNSAGGFTRFLTPQSRTPVDGVQVTTNTSTKPNAASGQEKSTTSAAASAALKANVVITNTPPPTATNISKTATPVSHEVALIGRTSSGTSTPTATSTVSASKSTPLAALAATAGTTATLTVTLTVTATATLSATATPTSLPTATNTATATPTAPPTHTATMTPTSTPSVPPTNTSTETPTETPSPTATDTATVTATKTATPLPTATNTPLPTATNTATPLPTATNTPLPTATNTATPLPTATNTPLPTATNTATPLPTATNTPLPTATNTAMPTPTPTATATNPPRPTAIPTHSAWATARPTEAIPSGVLIVTGTPEPLNLPWAMVSNPYEYKVAVRANTSPKAPVVAALASGSQIAGIGRTFDSAWILVQLPDGRQAWVLAKAVIVDQNYLPNLPIVTPNPQQ